MTVYSNGMRYQTSGKHAWWTTTWERAEKRRQKAFDADWGDFGQHKVDGPDKREELFNKIVDKAKKQHPEMKNIKARRYARTQDPIGRKFQRLKNQGYDVATISKKLGYNSKTGKFRASTGHSGG
ncbi:hypothetical protein [Lactobacillus gasseri]